MSNSISNNPNPIEPNTNPSNESVTPSNRTSGEAQVSQAVQGNFPTAPLAPPTNMANQKVTILEREVAPFLSGFEQLNTQLASKAGRDALILKWNALPQPAKEALTRDALKEGFRDVALFCLSPGRGVNPQTLFGNIEGLTNALASLFGTRKIHSECLNLVFKHPQLTDQDRTEIACGLILRRDGPALQECLQSLTDVSLRFKQKTILEHAEDIPSETHYHDEDLNDEAYTMRMGALRLLEKLVSDPRFAAQAGITNDEDKRQYMKHIKENS